MSRLVRNTLLIAASGALALGGLATTGAARAHPEGESSASHGVLVPVNLFLRLEGIEGDAQSDRYKGQIEILSSSFGVIGMASRTTTTTTTRPMQDISFTKHLDRSSPKLLEAVASGKVIVQAVLTMTRVGGDQQEIARLKLGNVVVTSYQTGVAAGGDPTETFSLSFATLEYQYVPLDPTGKPGIPITFMWKAGTTM